MVTLDPYFKKSSSEKIKEYDQQKRYYQKTDFLEDNELNFFVHIHLKW
jgi:hypothetical protein